MPLAKLLKRLLRFQGFTAAVKMLFHGSAKRENKKMKTVPASMVEDGHVTCDSRASS